MLVNSVPVAFPETELDLISPFITIFELAASILIEPAKVLPLFIKSGVVLSTELTAETMIVDIYIITTLDPVCIVSVVGSPLIVIGPTAIALFPAKIVTFCESVFA